MKKDRLADNLNEEEVEKLALADSASSEFTPEYLSSSPNLSLEEFVLIQDLETILEPDVKKYFDTHKVTKPLPLINNAIREYIQNHPL